MAVHHFTAVNLEHGADWQGIDILPKNGSVIVVCDASGNTAEAVWENDRLVIADRASLGVVTHWRLLEEEG